MVLLSVSVSNYKQVCLLKTLLTEAGIQRSISEAGGDTVLLPGNCPITLSNHIGFCILNARSASQALLKTS